MRNKQWECAIEELDKARYLFNNAETPYHVDVAIKGLNVAEDRLVYLRQKNRLESYTVTPEPIIKKQTRLQKFTSMLRRILPI